MVERHQQGKHSGKMRRHDEWRGKPKQRDTAGPGCRPVAKAGGTSKSQVAEACSKDGLRTPRMLERVPRDPNSES